MTGPVEPVGISNQPFYVRANQDWAVVQERYRHDQAMYTIGEPAMFTLMWKLEDFNAGLVTRCSRCYGTAGTLDSRITSVYAQPTQNKCPVCYGTTFQGGIRAQIVRPTVFSDTDDVEQKSVRGVTHPQNTIVESTSDFRARSGDYVFRIDGSRWQLATPERVTLRTGYGHPGQTEDTLGYARAQASLEDPNTVAYLIPPTLTSDLVTALSAPSRYPSTSFTDVINGPLIPPAITD